MLLYMEPDNVHVSIPEMCLRTAPYLVLEERRVRTAWWLKLLCADGKSGWARRAWVVLQGDRADPLDFLDEDGSVKSLAVLIFWI